MKKWKEKVLAYFLVALMVCNIFASVPMEVRAANTYTVTTEDELRSALETAVDGDVIKIGDEFTYANIVLSAPLEITKDITIHFVSGGIDYDSTNGTPADWEALVTINSCDVTISGSGQVGTAYNTIYAYKMVDTIGNASLIMDSTGFMDDGVLIVDDESNLFTSRVIINAGSYNVPTERTSIFTFSNGVEIGAVSSENLVIYGGNFNEDIAAYIGENTIIIDNYGTYEVRSSIMSDQFKGLLNDGKIIVPSPMPEDEESEGYAYLMGFLGKKVTSDYYYYPQYISDGVFDIARYDSVTDELLEIHRVEVEYTANIDAESLAITQKLAEKIPFEVAGSWEDDAGVVHEERWSPFVVTDMEVVNMWANGYDRNNLKSQMHTVNYSGELKEYLGNSNVDFLVTMVGAGEDTDLYLEACGDAVLFVNDMMGAKTPYNVVGKVNHIIYVPDGTATDKDSLIAAAQKRINEYLGSDSKVVVSYGGAFNTLSNMWWDDDTDYQNYMLECLGVEKTPEHYFIATSGNMQYKFLIMVDSSKMLSPTYKTVDAVSNVSISSESSEIPLDTSMRAKQLTSGETYNKVINTLGVEENVTYDLKLYSSTMDTYVSELEDGTFEVQIPVTDELKDKDLVAYYVDENDEIVEYEVIVKDGNACFTTDHFSIYTIAAAKDKADSNTGGSDSTPEEKPTYEVVVPSNNAAAGKVGDTVEELTLKVPFTEAEKSLIDAGAEVTITLEVKDIAETVSATDKALVANKLDDKQVGMYLDINLYKQIDNNTAVKVPELSKTMKIQLTIPESLINTDATMKREYSIIRIHEGVAEVLDAEFNATSKVLTFETDHFSTYALVYKDVEVAQTPPTSAPTVPSSPNTGDVSVVTTMAMFMLSGIGVVRFKKKK